MSFESQMWQKVDGNDDEYKPRTKFSKTLEDIGFNPNSTSKESFGHGLMSGLLMSVDPLGILLQYVGRQAGYDIKTVGGIALFGDAKADLEPVKKDTFGSIVGKVLAGGLGVGCWCNPGYVPFLLTAQVVTTSINIYRNFSEYKKHGTLKLDELRNYDKNQNNSGTGFGC